MASKQIFISYSHKDPVWLERFQINLKPYLRGSEVLLWDDTKIEAGTDWKEEINKALDSATIAILLVSADFLASDFIARDELPFLLQAAKEKNVRIVSVAISSSAWETTPLKDIQWANKPDRPLDKLDKADRAEELVRICKKVASFFGEQDCAPPVHVPVETAPVAAVLTAAAVATPAAVANIEPTTQSAEQGLLALVDLMRNPEVQAKVAAFDTVFETSSKQIEILGYYKDLHDLLHTLQFKFYTILSIARTAKKDPEDITIWDNVTSYVVELQDVLKGLNKAAQQTSNTRAALPWIQKLIDNLKALFESLEQNDATQLDKAIGPIQRILATEPSRINDRLAVAAEALPLPMLVDALSRVCDSLDSGRVNAVTMNKFEEGVHAIEELKGQLDALIDSHNQWQEIDIIIRRIEGAMAIDNSDLEESWPELKAKTEAQCGCSEEDWAQWLKKEIAKLDKALADADAPKIRQSFQGYRSRSNNRFYEVDLSLKELCSQLRKVGEPLTTVWEMIK